jgi:hypothetical protein
MFTPCLLGLFIIFNIGLFIAIISAKVKYIFIPNPLL